jgi:ribosomal protein L21
VIPTGKVVAHIGYNTKALTGDSYYVMNINENAHYNITLTEARPLITSYSVAIDVFENGKSKPVKAINFNRKKDICS